MTREAARKIAGFSAFVDTSMLNVLNEQPPVVPPPADTTGKNGQDKVAAFAHDEDDGASFSTVLSAQSQSDDESSVASHSSCLKQLEIEFKVRDKLLKKLTKGIDPIYAQVMRDNEAAARIQKLQRAQEKQRLQSSRTPDNNNNNTLPIIPDIDSKYTHDDCHGFLERIRQSCLCDVHNTLSGAAHLLFYCLAHSCCFQIIEVCTVAVTKSFKNQDAVATVAILASILLLRMTGGIWSYLTWESYRRVKFDMHNRLHQGKVDARVARWFRQHTAFRDFLNMVAFYISFQFVVYFHERYIEILDRKLLVLVDSLSSMKQQILNRYTCAIDGVCDLQEEAVVNERGYTLYYVTSAALAILLLQKLGHSFCKA